MVDNNNESGSNVMLTTLDNPFNPFTEFDQWYSFDVSKGYYTCSYLARIVLDDDELTEQDQSLEQERAIDEIVALNLLGIYVKVTPENFKDLIKVKVK